MSEKGTKRLGTCNSTDIIRYYLIFKIKLNFNYLSFKDLNAIIIMNNYLIIHGNQYMNKYRNSTRKWP